MLFTSHGSDRHDVDSCHMVLVDTMLFMSHGSDRHDVGSCHMVLVDMMLIHVTWFWSTRCCSCHMVLVDTMLIHVTWPVVEVELSSLESYSAVWVTLTRGGTELEVLEQTDKLIKF
ncbi:hypothetical protein RRG08_013821 [Elysia crispata]|uniref:Uncharacterized protein n=1 Tax=Elysia crispata TaxID=231223 RepID=A0AAE1BBT1_9GAST|nr:hypothetical protein RRG08_013821 [Elysia crispata]